MVCVLPFITGAFYSVKWCFIFSSACVRRGLGQAMFRRMNFSPSCPYMLPGFIRSFSFSRRVLGYFAGGSVGGGAVDPD